MPDILDELFTPDVVARLKAQAKPSNTLTQRIAILTSAETPGAPLSDRCWQRILLARRAAWVNYVTSMRDAGLLDADVTARLTGIEDDRRPHEASANFGPVRLVLIDPLQALRLCQRRLVISDA
jgi:hypothetical protein